MRPAERIFFIAEGLPLLLESARGFEEAARGLPNNAREAEVLSGFAEEEAAKILILLDIVRCPPDIVGSSVGKLMGWFYQHLARLLYAEATHWKPIDIKQLRAYVDQERKAHYLEGFAGQFIMPNWSIFSRESFLYVDVEAYEDGTVGWHSPPTLSTPSNHVESSALWVTKALDALGVFSPSGLQIVSQLWGGVSFTDATSYSQTRELTLKLLERLAAANLPKSEVNDRHVMAIQTAWQMPMYDLDLSLIEVSRDQLEEERDNELYFEMGCG